VYAIALDRLPDAQARALAFVAVVLSNLLAIFVSRIRGEAPGARIVRPNAIFWAISVGTLAALAAVLFVPAAAAVFRFSPPPDAALAAVLAASVALILLAAAVRVVRSRWEGR
jgi:Ca2+-transporting ATPase